MNFIAVQTEPRRSQLHPFSLDEPGPTATRMIAALGPPQKDTKDAKDGSFGAGRR